MTKGMIVEVKNKMVDSIALKAIKIIILKKVALRSLDIHLVRESLCQEEINSDHVLPQYCL